MVWQQVYDPFNNPVISTIMAAVPVVVMLAALAFFHIKAHLAALLALASALVIAIFAFGMPANMAGSAALYGAANGLLPIGGIVLNIIFLHRLTTENGSFKVLQDSLARITDDRRLQLLLIAFCFGAFFEGAAGFGTPVAVTGAILIGLGFSPLAASGLALIANTAPVAFGALGTPIITLAKVTGLDEMELSMMVGRQLPFFSVIVPFWLIWAFAGWRKMLEIWPAILVAGVSFAVPQFLVSNYHGPMLVDVVAALISMACLTGFLRVWKPATVHTSAALSGRVDNSRIADEHDEETPPLKREGEDFIAEARLELEDFKAETGIDLATPETDVEVDSLGGLVVWLLGRVPQRGEIIAHPAGYEFEVLEADPRKVKRLRIRRGDRPLSA